MLISFHKEDTNKRLCKNLYRVKSKVFSPVIKLKKQTDGIRMKEKLKQDWEQKAFYIIMGLMFAVTTCLTIKGTAAYVMNSGAEKKEAASCVVIDAGHGGDDPGKIGINGALEKEINLEIALMVKRYLEASDVKVIMTRETEAGLYDASASNKKVQDMKRRISLIEEAAPAVAVSIHQNSYQEEYVHGAQVFYYKDSAEGKRLAEILQNSFVKRVESENKREPKANASYYLLKKTQIPIVIVECGFLSNQAEADQLMTPEYQQKVAWAVYMGIMQYLNEADR